MIPKLFMKPIVGNNGDGKENGLEIEDIITLVLNRYVGCLKAKEYSIENIIEMGLLVNREIRICSTSLDVIF